MRRNYLGCDPGTSGAICILSPWTSETLFYDTPGGKQPPGNLCIELAYYAPTINVAAIEDVHSLYGMSAKSNFNFGRNVGMVTEAIETALAIQDNAVKLTKVQPKIWQKEVGITAKGKAIKQAVADLAHTLYPKARLYGPRGGLLDGRADALMIAHWLRLQEEPCLVDTHQEED
jgi:hypothetical protein